MSQATGKPPRETPHHRAEFPEGVLGALIKLLSTVVGQLKTPLYLFAIGFGILLVLSLVVSSVLQTLTPLYVVIGALMVLALAVLGFEMAQMAVGARSSESTTSQLDNEIVVPESAPRAKPQTSSDKVELTTEQTVGQVGGKREQMTHADQFNMLLDFIQLGMTASEFEEMVARLLVAKERLGLPVPLTRVGFLDSMRIFGRLDDVERYLLESFTNRFRS